MESPLTKPLRPEDDGLRTDCAEAQDGVPAADGTLLAAPAAACVADQAPPERQAGDAPAVHEQSTVSSSSEEEELIKNWPTLDATAGRVSSLSRRWPLFVLPLVLLGGVSLYAMWAGSNKNGSASPSGCAATAGENSSASGRRAGELGQGEAKQAGGQRVDQAAGLPAAGARDAADDSQVAAVDAEPKPLSTAGDAAGSRPLPTRSETPIPAAGGDLAQASTPGDAAPAPDELTERCRRADAGGRGRPQSVLTACRPAIEANPDSADIMVMLARAAMDLGRVSEARTWAKKALQINRNLPDAYVFLGGAEQGLGRPAEAKAAYKKYIELAPGGRHARELRAVLDSL